MAGIGQLFITRNLYTHNDHKKQKNRTYSNLLMALVSLGSLSSFLKSSIPGFSSNKSLLALQSLALSKLLFSSSEVSLVVSVPPSYIVEMHHQVTFQHIKRMHKIGLYQMLLCSLQWNDLLTISCSNSGTKLNSLNIYERFYYYFFVPFYFLVLFQPGDEDGF